MQRIYAGGFLRHVIEVDVDGEIHKVIPRDYQLDPVRDYALHVDFLRIGAGSRITVDVAVHFVNQDQCPGLKRGGVLNVVRHTVEVQLPGRCHSGGTGARSQPRPRSATASTFRR